METVFSEIVVESLITAVLFSAIPLSVSLIVGMLVSVFQAATQINEQTLSFVPKLASVVVTLVILSSWMIDKLKDLTLNALEFSMYYQLP